MKVRGYKDTTLKRRLTQGHTSGLLSIVKQNLSFILNEFSCKVPLCDSMYGEKDEGNEYKLSCLSDLHKFKASLLPRKAYRSISAFRLLRFVNL